MLGSRVRRRSLVAVRADPNRVWQSAVRSTTSMSKTMRWPWRRMRKIEPVNEPGCRKTSERSSSRTINAGTGHRVVDLDDTLHRSTFCTFPARMQDAQTRARRVLEPCFTRTIWIFGSQRRLFRLWEKLTVLP